MRKIITLLVLCTAFGSMAQQKVAERVQELKSQSVSFKSFSVLTPQTDVYDRDIEKVVSGATFAKIQTAAVNDIVNHAYEAIELAIPYAGSMITVSLYRAEPLHKDFYVVNERQAIVPYESGVHYRGIVKGDENSIASFNFFNGELNGIISDYTVHNLVIGKLDRAGNTQDYIVYSDANMHIENTFGCFTKDEDLTEPEPLPQYRNATTAQRCVTMYFEVDHNLFQLNGNSVTATTNWMTSVFNNVQTLYENAGINVAIRSMFIWTTPDPYTGTSSGQRLNQFNQHRPVFDGDVGQLIAVDPGSLGGVAASVNGLCSQNNYSYSDVDFSHAAVPIYSWTVEVITHELGHLLGSPHTHACVWNGNNTAIDNCGPTAMPGSEGSSCKTTPPTLPTAAVKGTIMSYCHLVAGIGINLANGFGPQPAQRMINAMNAAPCLSVDCTTTCINTAANIQVINVTTNSAEIVWEDRGEVDIWNVSVSTLTGAMNWQVSNGESFTVNNLQPNTYYRARIRPACTSGQTTFHREVIFATAGNWCSGITISDTGGPTGNYGNNQNIIRVIAPDTNDKKIRINFTSFKLENGFDYLHIYDGASTNAPLIGTYTGMNSPGSVMSSSPDGALTFRFVSDLGMADAGYVATVSCESKLSVGNYTAGVHFNYYPNPTNSVVNIVSNEQQMTQLEVYNITGQLLMSRRLNDMEAQIDIESFATGTYFFKVQFGTAQANFKILKR